LSSKKSPLRFDLSFYRYKLKLSIGDKKKILNPNIIHC